MRVSTSGRYGVRIMLDLAMEAVKKPAARQEIADRQGIPSEYIAQLCRHLTRAGLTKGIKGPGGGYILAKDANSIRIGEIFRAVEGPIAAVFCVQGDGKMSCTRVDSCAAHVLWEKLSRVIEDYLDSVTLGELCLAAKSLQPLSNESQMYGMDTILGNTGDEGFPKVFSSMLMCEDKICQ